MIKLEQVSTNEFLKSVHDRSEMNELCRYIYELLYVYDVDDYQKLKDLILGGGKDLDRTGVLRTLKERLEMVERNVYNANLQGRTPQIFPFDLVDVSSIDAETLSITDKANDGSSLLFANPIARSGYRMRKVNRISVEELKYLLTHLDAYNLCNCFVQMREFGADTARKVESAINMYHEQLLRQADETSLRGVDLFRVNKELKDEIVEAQLKEIIEYILDTADECVWGKMSDTQKKKMRSASVSVKGCYIQEDRRNLIDMISNYTTLGELEQGVVKKRTLNRFIVK